MGPVGNFDRKYIFILFFAIAVIYPLINIQIIYPLFTELLVKNTEDEASRTASHLASMYFEERSGGRLPIDFEEEVNSYQDDFMLEKIKVFTSDGTIIYSTDAAEIGNVNENDYFHDIVASGNKYTKVVEKDQTTLEGRTVTRDVVETYIPIIKDGKFVGAFEIYYDITERNDRLNHVVFTATLIPLVLMVISLIGVTVALVKWDKPELSEAMLKLPRRFRSPYYPILIMIVAIFIGEVGLMIILTELPYLPPVTEAAIDGSILVLLLSPVLYYLIARPLMLHIAQREKVEKALLIAEKQFRTAIEKNIEGVFVLDSSKIVVYMNPAVEELMCQTSDEIIGKPFKYPIDQGTDIEITLPCQGASGTRICEMRSADTYWQDEPATIVWTRDITARKNYLEAIERSSRIQHTLNTLLRISLKDIPMEDMLEEIIDEILAIPWLVLEKKGSIFLVEDEPGVLVLKAQRGLAGPLLEKCARVPFGRCHCGMAAQTKKMVFSNTLDESHTTTYTGIGAHGHICTPIVSMGEVIGVLNLYVKAGHLEDEKEEEFLDSVANVMAGIINRKRLENSIKKYAEDLEESNGMKDLFMDIMAHDILNPVTIIKSMSQMMLSDDPDNEAMNMILNADNKIIDVVDSARRLSKLRNLDQIELEELDLGNLIEGICKDVKIHVEEAGMVLENRVPAGFIVQANPMIGEVFLNFFTNAVKYANDGKRIVIDAQDEGTSYKIGVADFGQGIPDDAMEDVFNRFERRDRKDVKGTGLGLAIVKRLVEMHSGKVWVENHPEGGTIFYVRLPKYKKEG